MTVTEVLMNFRQALLAILPAVQKVGIPWQRPDSYDEWDDIASVLFNSLVIKFLQWSMPSPILEKFKMPKYDLFLENYTGLCVLEVRHSGLQEGRYLFHSFGTEASPFDVVEMRCISGIVDPASHELVLCPVKGASFVLRLDSSTGSDRLVEEVHEGLASGGMSK
jgi:hypothetical protein